MFENDYCIGMDFNDLLDNVNYEADLDVGLFDDDIVKCLGDNTDSMKMEF
jgi:hypothetical protein